MSRSGEQFACASFPQQTFESFTLTSIRIGHAWWDNCCLRRWHTLGFVTVAFHVNNADQWKATESHPFGAGIIGIFISQWYGLTFYNAVFAHVYTVTHVRGICSDSVASVYVSLLILLIPSMPQFVHQGLPHATVFHIALCAPFMFFWYCF